MTNGLTDAEARAALEEIEHGRRQIINEIDVPPWYWPGLAVGWIALGLATDVRNQWLTAGATLAFGAIHASVAHVAIGGRHRSTRLSVHPDVAGRHTPLLVIAGLIGLALLTTVGAIAASADGARHPATMVSVLVAVLIVLGGPRCMAALRRRAAAAAPAGPGPASPAPAGPDPRPDPSA
ncbi:MAG: hypothetical protein QOG43_1282 [Actinomycetota bacterium]|jgi:hypothetical protein|nr:hypothetical protein [Actinomycetota bacterium]